MKITVIGTGYVGLVTGTCLAETGNEVICVDIDRDKVDKAFSKSGDIKLYTALEKMMLLSIDLILKESNLEITEKTGLIIATTKGNIDVLSPKSIFYNEPVWRCREMCCNPNKAHPF